MPRVRDDLADAALLRLPLERDGLSVIGLYTEVSVVVVPAEHAIAAVEEVTVADLEEETVLHPPDDVLDWAQLPGEEAFERPATTEGAISHVASEIGILVTPQPLARLHHRKDLTYRPVLDAPQSQVGLVWAQSTAPPTSSTSSSESRAAARRTAHGAGRTSPARRPSGAGNGRGQLGRSWATRNPRRGAAADVPRAPVASGNGAAEYR